PPPGRTGPDRRGLRAGPGLRRRPPPAPGRAGDHGGGRGGGRHPGPVAPRPRWRGGGGARVTAAPSRRGRRLLLGGLALAGVVVGAHAGSPLPSPELTLEPRPPRSTDPSGWPPGR